MLPERITLRSGFCGIYHHVDAEFLVAGVIFKFARVDDLKTSIKSELIRSVAHNAAPQKIRAKQGGALEMADMSRPSRQRYKARGASAGQCALPQGHHHLLGSPDDEPPGVAVGWVA